VTPKVEMPSNITAALLFDHTGTYAPAVEQRASMVVRKTTFDIEGEIKNNLSRPGTGRIYKAGGTTKRGKGRRTHQASAPGQPPATDTGTLVNSVKARMLSATQGIVEETAEYSKFLEYGTVRMAARPHFWPAVHKHSEAFVQAMKQVGTL
jgi:hypothetical protein